MASIDPEPQQAPHTVDIIAQRAVLGHRKRLDFAEFKKNKIRLILYLHALEHFKNTDPKSPTSYFQICGVHGVPHKTWDDPAASTPKKDYCEHGTLLFPTWHRPYMELYEIGLINSATEVYKKEFFKHEDKDKYAKALKELGMPYWKWEAPPPHNYHDEFDRKEVELPYLEGDKWVNKTVPNPLLNYTLQDDVGTRANHKKGKTTNRDPDLRGVFDEIQRSLKEEVDSFMNEDTLWFASKAQRRRGLMGAAQRLEAPHGTVHDKVGGWMGSVPTAGFDPIFWLHHSNVERLLCLFQQKNKKLYVPKADQKTALVPFFTMDQGGAWQGINSEQIRSVANLPYKYVEFSDPVAAAAAAAPFLLLTPFDAMYELIFPEMNRALPPDEASGTGSYEITVRLAAEVEEQKINASAGVVSMFLRPFEDRQHCNTCLDVETSADFVVLNPAMHEAELEVKWGESDDALKQKFSSIIHLSGAHINAEGPRSPFLSDAQLRSRILAPPVLAITNRETREKKFIELDLPQLRSQQQQAASTASS